MTMSPDDGEDILAFGRTEPAARGPRKWLLFGAAGGTGLAGAAVAVGLLAFGAGAAPATHQLTVTQRAVADFAVPAGTVRVVTLNAATGRPTCHHP
jgi:hypothetical protein